MKLVFPAMMCCYLTIIPKQIDSCKFDKVLFSNHSLHGVFNFLLFIRLLATTSADTTIRIWKTIDFSKVAELSLGAESTQRWVWDCAFSEDSQYIISGKCS